MPCPTSSLFSTRTRTIILVVDYVGWLLYLVCYLTPSWITYRYESLTMSLGIYLVCVHGACSTLIDSDGLFRMAQIIGSTGLAAYVMFAISATMTFFWTKHWRKLKGLKMAAGIFAIIAGICLVAAVMLMKQSKDAAGSKFSYSSLIGFVAAGIALIVSPFYIIDGFTTSKHVIPPDDHRQKRWDRTSPLPVLPSFAPQSTYKESLKPGNPSQLFDDFVENKPMPSNKPSETNTYSDMIKMIKEKLASVNKPTEIAHDFEREVSFIHPAPKPVGDIVSPQLNQIESDDDDTFVHPAPNPKGHIPPNFNENLRDENEIDLESYVNDPVFGSLMSNHENGKDKKKSKNKKIKFDKSAFKSKLARDKVDTPVFPSLQKHVNKNNNNPIDMPTTSTSIDLEEAQTNQTYHDISDQTILGDQKELNTVADMAKSKSVDPKTKKTKSSKKKRKQKDKVLFDVSSIFPDRLNSKEKQSLERSKTSLSPVGKPETSLERSKTSLSAARVKPEWEPSFVTAPQKDPLLTNDIISDSEAE